MTAHQVSAFNDAFGDDPTARMRGKGKAEFDDPAAALKKLNSRIAQRHGQRGTHWDKNVAHHSLRRKLEAIQPKDDATSISGLSDSELESQLRDALRQKQMAGLHGRVPQDVSDRVAALQAERARRLRPGGAAPKA
jgi:hypothetical protein